MNPRIINKNAETKNRYFVLLTYFSFFECNDRMLKKEVKIKRIRVKINAKLNITNL
ncbi:MAG: hypothetical protein SVZ03_11030 [Spirochaetota bacterium]|nr:hypothetical protein [Spirochaetota bacterium]